MKSINWQTIGYVILGIFMLICYAYVDGNIGVQGVQTR